MSLSVPVRGPPVIVTRTRESHERFAGTEVEIASNAVRPVRGSRTP
ncbi:MAG TPA: hypothetical protein VEK13_04955 [Thermoplasmata archaeon]|nr:hypothetical protein [Thermoplasmata archaeon]